MITLDPHVAIDAALSGERFVIFNGDCRKLIGLLPTEAVDLAITSPPYFLGKSFDTSKEVSGFTALHSSILPDVTRSLKEKGNLCWQVGNHIEDGVITPLDVLFYNNVSQSTRLQLRNRIIWTFGHGAHARRRFSGRYETALWFSKSPTYYFDLDAARVPQKYRGKKYYKGPRKGEWSSNPAGKNPGDVWDIPNVKANHVEKTIHPCQFPVALAQRLIRALSPQEGIVFDPFAGVASAGIAAALEGRQFLGAELDSRYCDIAMSRWLAVQENTIRYRPLDKPLYQPNPRSAVARDPFLLREDSVL